jgi:O-antigen/teichoic acid export membrane protein
LETGYFYFARREANSKAVFGTAFLSHFSSTILFVIVSLIYIDEIAVLIKFKENSGYIIWFIFVLGFDTLSAVPFAKLRSENKAFRFALIKTISVVFNVLLNFVLLFIIPKYLLSSNNMFLGFRYEVTIQMIFVINFISSLLTLFLLVPDILRTGIQFNADIWKRLLLYSLPLMVAGLAGTVNEAIDRVLLQHLLPDNIATSEIGIYGSNIKLAVIMTLFIQMFRFAAEPFFFNLHKSEDKDKVFSDVTRVFILFGLIIFLAVTCYLDILKYFVGREQDGYWAGLSVVPVYLMANLALGIYFNLSFWYKLSNKTYYGILITGVGACVSIGLNFILIPRFSYMGCAWVHLITYIVMNILSYFLGKKYTNIRYDFRSIFTYFFIALIVFTLAYFVKIDILILQLLKNTMLLVGFLIYLEKREHIISIFRR